MARMRREERGFVLSGVALLLVLPAMFLSSFALLAVKEGSEAAATQGVADKVAGTGRHLENQIKWMHGFGISITNARLDSLEQESTGSTGLLVSLDRTDNIVTVYVQDAKGIARYSSAVDLSAVT